MRNCRLPYLFFTLMFIITSLTSCKKDENSSTLPNLATLGANNITEVSADSGGIIVQNGGESITARGVCWDTSANPTIDLTTTSMDGKGAGSYTSSLENLSSGTTYYIRAYATNKTGIAYGNEISFTTTESTAELVTSPLTNITFDGVFSGGNITHDGGSNIAQRGICWGQQENPSLETSSYTEDGTGIGPFISQLTNLRPSEQYYLRAYAINETGISYGAQISFQTLKNLASVQTDQPIEISYESARVKGSLIENGGDNILELGLCYGTSTLPTLENTKVTANNGESLFSLKMDNLTPGTVYFVRSFATNSVGTSYGNEVSFTTLEGALQLGYFFEGGIIFYLDETGEHGLVCTTEDQPSVEWGCRNQLISGTNAEIGSGQQNTNNILAQCNSTISAARVCADLISNGYDDWFLPSKDELNLIRKNVFLNNLGGEFGSYYRSSTENDGNSVWTQQFIDGQQYTLWKGSTVSIRAVRAF